MNSRYADYGRMELFPARATDVPQIPCFSFGLGIVPPLLQHFFHFRRTHEHYSIRSFPSTLLQQVFTTIHRQYLCMSGFGYAGVVFRTGRHVYACGHVGPIFSVYSYRLLQRSPGCASQPLICEHSDVELHEFPRCVTYHISVTASVAWIQDVTG